MEGIRGTQLMGTGSPVGGAAPLSGAWVREVIDALTSFRPALPNGTVPDGRAELIDQLRDLEDLKSAAAAAQARIAVSFDAAQRSAETDLGVPADERGRDVAAQIAMARRESPAKGSRLLGLAKALVSEMPRTLLLKFATAAFPRDQRRRPLSLDFRISPSY